ncbi:MAG TPA: hypothetical protein VII25_13390 [Candidatus Acidoferrum sp.]|jgi:hypothetical protein
MRKYLKFAGVAAVVMLALGTLGASKAAAQDPILTPILVDTAVPIIVNAIKPKPSGLGKFEGYVMHANSIQVTVRAKNNETAVQTFPLTGEAASKMQAFIEKGGFQYGDKITVYYDPQSLQAVKFKGKPSRAQ